MGRRKARIRRPYCPITLSMPMRSAPTSARLPHGSGRPSLMRSTSSSRMEPAVETRNRKSLRPNALASWELRVGDLRVYYDVQEDPEQQVNVAAIGIKVRSRVLIAGRLYDL